MVVNSWIYLGQNDCFSILPLSILAWLRLVRRILRQYLIFGKVKVTVHDKIKTKIRVDARIKNQNRWDKVKPQQKWQRQRVKIKDWIYPNTRLANLGGNNCFITLWPLKSDLQLISPDRILMNHILIALGHESKRNDCQVKELLLVL